MPKVKKTLKNLSELKKAIDILPTEQRDAAECLFAEISFLHDTLEKLKDDINENGAIIKTGWGNSEQAKENPALKSYNVSIMRYSQLIKQIIDMLPKATKEEINPLLDFIKS